MEKELLENIIKKKVCLDENIGLSNSGSGHISETDFTINSISILEKIKHKSRLNTFTPFLLLQNLPFYPIILHFPVHTKTTLLLKTMKQLSKAGKSNA